MNRPSRTPSALLPFDRLSFDGAMCVFTAALPVLVAVLGLEANPPASHDDAVVRTVGLGFTGLFRGLDVLVAAVGMLLPFGTRALRAALGSALVTGVAGVAGFVVARSFLAEVANGRFGLARFGFGRGPAPGARLLSAVAALAVATAVAGPLWQTEATAPGGAVVGAALVLVTLALAPRLARGQLGGVALAVGLSASYEPLVGLASLAAVAPWLTAMPRTGEEAPDPASRLHASVCFLLGLLPLALGFAVMGRSSTLSLEVPLFSGALGSEDALRGGKIGAFVAAELGVAIAAVGVVGTALALLVPEARRLAASLGSVAAVGGAAILAGAPASASRIGAPVLAAIVVVHVAMAVVLAVVVIGVARARVPFARASAALVVVLELVLPVRAVDDTLAMREHRAPDAASVWSEAAWGSAPSAAVVLVADPSTMRRIVASRATGEMRGDLLVVPAFAFGSRSAHHALAREPKLAPLYRDVALGVAPEELSLAQLAADRPLVASFDPRWDRALARHFVPMGLSSIFEPEPRGASDRRRALEGFAGNRERLVRSVVARRDPHLAGATARLLRARAIAMAACGDRDVLSRALDDLRPFAPDDAVAQTLVRRIVTTKGPIEIRDLPP